VLERADELREDGAAIGIMPNGVLALDALGLGAAVRERDPGWDSAAACSTGSVARCWSPTRPPSTGARGARGRGGPPLAARAADRRAAGRDRAHRQPGGCVTDVRDGAHVVVVADGARSRLRAELFPDHPGLVGSGETARAPSHPACPTG
jgi:2-polyprenyl-6-methoxyphenol hydroxylase-like FAD-dependent oxidoreductase